MSARPCLRYLQVHKQQIRPFSRTTCWSHPAPTKVRTSPRASPKAEPQTATRQSQAANILRTARPPQPQHAVPTPPRQPPRPSRSAPVAVPSTLNPYAERLLANRDQVLLYKAPGHNAFMIASFLTGLGIITYAGSNVYMFIATPTSDNMAIVKYIVAVGGMLAGSMGFAITMAPVRLLRSARLVRAGVGGESAVLQFEGKRPLPFLPNKKFAVPLGNVWADRNVPMSLRTWHDVPIKNADLWTEGLLPNPGTEHFRNLGFFQKLVYMSASIMPAIQKNVRRMFNREGMVYLRIGAHNWKMDLQGCEILEAGGPMMKLVEHDPAVRGTLYDAIRRAIAA